METTLKIDGMHCPSCVKRLTDAFQKMSGVRSARVTLNPPEAHIESEGAAPPSLQVLDQAARSAGNYSVTVPQTSSQPLHAHSAHETIEPSEPKPSIFPLVLIVGYIAATVALTTYFRGDRTWTAGMLDFMAGFFLVFSFFKLLDLRGFADAYQSYDIIARHSRPYALVYPFIELALGIAYLLRWQPSITNWVTLIIMLIGSVGVLRALLKKNAIRSSSAASRALGTRLSGLFESAISPIGLREDHADLQVGA